MTDDPITDWKAVYDEEAVDRENEKRIEAREAKTRAVVQGALLAYLRSLGQ